MDKIIKLEISGPEAIIDACLTAFCYSCGYVDGMEESKEIYARGVLRAFIIERVAKYNTDQLKQSATQQGLSQTNQAIEQTTMTLSVQASSAGQT